MAPRQGDAGGRKDDTPKEPNHGKSEGKRMDAYVDLDARTKAEIELNALPKDENHPFVSMTGEQAAAYVETYLESKGPEQFVEPGDIQRINTLKEAYAARCACDHTDDPTEYQAQEQAILDSLDG